jgi:hypothetical protein
MDHERNARAIAVEGEKFNHIPRYGLNLLKPGLCILGLGLLLRWCTSEMEDPALLMWLIFVLGSILVFIGATSSILGVYLELGRDTLVVAADRLQDVHPILGMKTEVFYRNIDGVHRKDDISGSVRIDLVDVDDVEPFRRQIFFPFINIDLVTRKIERGFWSNESPWVIEKVNGCDLVLSGYDKPAEVIIETINQRLKLWREQHRASGVM